MPANDYSSDNQEPQPAAGRPKQWPAFVLLIDGVPTGRIDADQLIDICAVIACEFRRLKSRQALAPTLTVRRFADDDVAGLPPLRSMPDCTAVAVRMLLGGAK